MVTLARSEQSSSRRRRWRRSAAATPATERLAPAVRQHRAAWNRLHFTSASGPPEGNPVVLPRVAASLESVLHEPIADVEQVRITGRRLTRLSTSSLLRVPPAGFRQAFFVEVHLIVSPATGCRPSSLPGATPWWSTSTLIHCALRRVRPSTRLGDERCRARPLRSILPEPQSRPYGIARVRAGRSDEPAGPQGLDREFRRGSRSSRSTRARRNRRHRPRRRRCRVR